MITEAIILAGGLGTRLREAVPDLPKCMAPVAGRPFISHVIDALRMQGIRRLIFSLGYRSEIIEEYLTKQYPALDYLIVVETEPLGTGGAIRLAIEKAETKNVLVANGDTLFRIDMKSMMQVHDFHQSECTLALKPMKNFDRYGRVEIAESGLVLSFNEKQWFDEGLINGGIYLLNRDSFKSRPLPAKFSFEKDYLEKYTSEKRFFGSVQEGYFIDIGIPDDFIKAQSELARPPFELGRVDKNWSLFLDRDGVINDELSGRYVMEWSEFIFSKGVLDTFKKLSDSFGYVFIVSNQRGVGKGLMTEAGLQSIHLEMQREVAIVGGKIDRIYYCTDTEEKCFHRKPNPGMALRALEDFPGIDLSRAIMVGNKPGDMSFGRAAGMFTVFIRSTNPGQPFPHPDIDAVYDSLSDFAMAVSGE